MSSLDFAAGEILELAEEIERNGASFYRRAAALATDDGTRRLLEDLAASEEGHERTFQGLRASLAAGPSRRPTLDPDEQAALYLRAFASRTVFDTRVSPEELLDDDVSDEEVFRMALGMEKDSIALYAGLRGATTDAVARAAVDDILREEMSHVTVLADAIARSRR